MISFPAHKSAALDYHRAKDIISVVANRAVETRAREDG